MARWAFLIAMLAVAARGDEWIIKKKFTVLSANKKFRVELTRGKEAVFSARGALGLYVRKATFPILNSPHWAAVSNDGMHLVTFDEAGALGYGDNVVAVYQTSGTLVRSFSLGQLLTLDDIDTFSKSVSSIWWGGKHYFNDNGQLVLRVVSNGKQWWENDATFHELRIDLATGEPIEPKRDLFTAIHRKNTIRFATPKQPLPESFAEARCLPNAVARFDQPYTSPDLLHANPVRYPRLAIEARMQATVIADVQLNAQGVVDCVRIRQGHLLFREATYEVLLNAEANHASAARSAVAVVFELGR